MFNFTSGSGGGEGVIKMDNGGVVGLRSNLLVIIIVIVLFICP